ncbi:MAG: folylpolyglutamate synthase/dihydrofolate synthase family protein [Polyangia bacterium]|nr:folylpolyglutamate synthase/dihydrofolate synthase family protein [Polyangia bacterium]
MSALLDYREVLEDLFRLRRFGVKLSLLPVERALGRMGSPALGMPCIQIGGSNAKGSVAAMVEAMLRADGRKTGLFTSPHLCRFTERIRVAGQEISRAEVVRHYRRIRAEAPELTFFEVATAMAALCFAEHGAEVGVIEVGLGGRMDATCYFDARVTGFGPIGLEHTPYLGVDLDRIAWEKGRMMRPGVPAASSATDPVVLAVHSALAELEGVPFHLLGRDFSAARLEGGRMRYEGPGGALELPAPPLGGPHQLDNAALALALVGLLPEPLRPSDEARRQGIAGVVWPGRMELLPGPPRVLLDAGHNPQAVRALLGALGELERRRTIFVVAAMLDKDLSGLLGTMLSAANEAILTRVQYYRGAPPEELLRKVPEKLRQRCRIAPDLATALEEARSMATDPEDLVVVAGSVFLVGEARALLLGEETDPVKVTDPVATR